ncbi:MAG: glycosyltransferase family 4 protein [Gammaproteobacteria bacterium]
MSDTKASVQPRHATACRSVLMVGTHTQAMGGISTVVRGYQDGGLFERFDCVYVDTHRDGSGWLKAWAAVSGWCRIAFYLTKLEAPLVHIHMSSRASFWRKAVICLLARAWGRPYVVHVHGSEFMVFHDEECGPLAQRFMQWIFARAALVIAISEQWRASLLGISPEASVVVITNAVALPNLAARSAAPAGRHVILCLGRLGRRKGSFDMVQAFARLAAQFPDWRLVCAGDGEVAETRALAKECGVEERVTCPGWLDSESTHRALAAAAIFALPSYAEGLPMALLEAMSWRLPVITSAVGGIPQVVRQGDNGVLVTPGDIDGICAALTSLMTSEAERERLGAAARRTIEAEFSQAPMIQRLSEMYGRFGMRARG